MNTMKGFYASISSASRLRGSYPEALSEITRMSYKNVQALRSDQGWQNWGPQNQIMTTYET
jgi:hypothetical protein